MKPTFLLLLLLLVAAPEAAGQERAALFGIEPGARIRLPLAGQAEPSLIARVLRSERDTLTYVVEGSGEIRKQDLLTLRAVDVEQRSRKGSVRTGITWGLFLGSAVGVIAGPFFVDELSMGTEGAVATLGAIGGLTGGAAGGAAGALLVPGRWHRYQVQ